jgi:predicted nucleotidyltransferase
LTIENHAHLVRDERIRFYFVPEEVLDVGATTLDYDGAKIKIYDKERLLIDTARMKGSLPIDQYKEVINHYRGCRDTLDASKFPEYLERFPQRDRIMRIIDEEVY